MFTKLFIFKQNHHKEVPSRYKAKNAHKTSIFSTTKMRIFSVFILDKNESLE